ncbi:MAG: hypothetical protein AB7R89_26300 [Dehalococcoidia bacterium]
MPTLTDFRNRVKATLGISGSSAERGFDDPSLDQHIRQAVEEFSVYVPVEATADLTVLAGDRTLSAAGLTRLLRVAAVELPVGQWPRSLTDFDRWHTTLTLDIAPPSVDTAARVYYEQGHLVDGSGSTIDPAHEYVIVEGASALALLARVAGAAQTLETATTQPQTYQHLRLAQSRLARWRAQLRRLGGRLVQRRVYAPSASPLQRSVVADV